MPPRVNLLSDTQSRPTAAMRRAIAEAEVGDEQIGADPTVNELCARVAELLGFEAAVFMPSGTMCNEIAIRLHVRPGGDALYAHRSSHVLQFEGGAPAASSGAAMMPLEGEAGMFDAAALEAALPAPVSRYSVRPRVVCVEQTTNVGGGRIWPLSQVRAVLDVARSNGMRAHLDGARLMNAVVASGVDAREWCAGFDTAWIDFSKGLGAPVGAALAGSPELIDEAWRYKQMLGGAMRQAGIIAAGALHALDHHVDRLAEDHRHARLLAEGLAAIDSITIDPAAVETNMVFFSVPDSDAFVAALAARGIAMGSLGGGVVRAVTHLDVSRQDVELALAEIHAVAGAMRAAG